MLAVVTMNSTQKAFNSGRLALRLAYGQSAERTFHGVLSW